MNLSTSFIAATASPRRHKILAALGINFSVVVAECDEVHYLDDPARTVLENAALKHAAVAKQEQYRNAWVLAADTIVWFDNKCLGKPATLAEAKQMLMSYAGKKQTVYTGVAVSAPNQELHCFVVTSTLLFKNYSESVVDEYMRLIDCLGRAGAYDIDEYGKKMLIESYEGSYTNIMGLPQEQLAEVLKEMNFFK